MTRVNTGRGYRPIRFVGLLYSSVLTGGLLLVNAVAVAPAYAAACSTANDSADQTECTPGVSNVGLTYVGSNTFPYGGADFTLILDGHDVAGLPAGQVGITFTGVTAGNDGTIILRNGSDVTSGIGANGISSSAANAGTTTLISIETGSTVAGDTNGIFSTATGGGTITVNTQAGTTVTGNNSDGIHVEGSGAGNVIVSAQGAVTGSGSDGIDATAVDGTVSVTTGAGAIHGSTNAIFANSGTNAVTVTTGAGTLTSTNGTAILAVGDSVTVDTHGNVTSTGIAGIIAQADNGTLSVTTAAGTTVSGVTSGIFAIATGATGDATVNASSTVTGGISGITANSANGTTSVTTGAGAVTGNAGNGITATGATGATVSAGGDVSGSLNGINAQSVGGDVAITTAAGALIRGGTSFGIAASAVGTSLITITNNADTRGNGGGIRAASGTGAISITNNGTVSNTGGLQHFPALSTDGGSATFDNNGTLIGTVDLGGSANIVNNNGLWLMADGLSDMGDGAASVVNNFGTLSAARGHAVLEGALFINLNTFNNWGVVTLVDDLAGDVLLLDQAADYVGQGGRLVVDAFLAEGGASDQLWVRGDTSGTTFVVVNLTNPIGSSPNFDGIPVVEVTGTTAEADFELPGGVLNAGFFAWGLRRDGLTHELFTLGAGAGAYEFAAGITGAQEIGHQTLGTLQQRQADLRALLEGSQVTPVADYADPVEPTPVANITPGFWFRGIGAYIERDDEENGFVLDRDQTIWGGMAGFDFGEESAGQAWLFGLFAGYLASDLDFNETNSEWTYEGPTVGAYVTFIDHAFHADLTVKADFLDIDIDAEDLAPVENDADTDATNLGARIDAGYKFGDTFFIEPQATLAVIHTEIDDVDIFGGTVEFDDETSLRGRLGLRVGFDHTGTDAVVYSGDVIASVWEEFQGDNDVSIAVPGLPSFGVSDDAGGTLGDVSLGFSMASPDGWSGFLRANYQFAEDYDAISGNAGVRYAW